MNMQLGMPSPFCFGFFFFFLPCFFYQERFRFLIKRTTVCFQLCSSYQLRLDSLLPPSCHHCLCSLDTSAADTQTALERYFELKLSFTFLCSFAASDLLWLAHRSPQGPSWAAYGLPLLKARADLLPQFRWKCLGMAVVLCVLFWTENLWNSPHAFFKVKINMLQREQNT